MTDDPINHRQRQWFLTALLVVIDVISQYPPRRDWWIETLYLLLYLLWVWIPRPYRTFRHALIFTTISAVGLVWIATNPSWRPLTFVLLLPYAGIIAGRATRTEWSLAALIGLAAMRVILSHGSPVNLIGNLITLGGIYFGVYGARLRREARLLDKQRLAELETAHTTLQTAHQQLIETTALAMESRSQAERLAIAADIHDGIGHRLTSLIIGLESMEMMLPEDATTAQHRLPDLVMTARQALMEVRQAAHAGEDAETALQRESYQQLIETAAFGGHWDTHVSWEAKTTTSWPTRIRVTLFRILQESLTNILRHAHAHARQVWVVLEEQEEHITVRIADDGTLVTPPIPGFGLTQMRHRCQLLGGTLDWATHLPHGLVVTARIPLAPRIDP